MYVPQSEIIKIMRTHLGRVCIMKSTKRPKASVDRKIKAKSLFISSDVIFFQFFFEQELYSFNFKDKKDVSDVKNGKKSMSTRRAWKQIMSNNTEFELWLNECTRYIYNSVHSYRDEYYNDLYQMLIRMKSVLDNDLMGRLNVFCEGCLQKGTLSFFSKDHRFDVSQTQMIKNSMLITSVLTYWLLLYTDKMDDSIEDTYNKYISGMWELSIAGFQSSTGENKDCKKNNFKILDAIVNYKIAFTKSVVDMEKNPMRGHQISQFVEIEDFGDDTLINSNEMSIIDSEDFMDKWLDKPFNLLIYGIGGIGKTVFSLRLWDRLIAHNRVAIYIPIYQLYSSYTSDIKDYINNSVVRNIDSVHTWLEFKNLLDGYEPILILDGINEIDPMDKRKLIVEINELISDFTIVITSRNNVIENIPRAYYKRLNMKKLSKGGVLDFLNHREIQINKNNWKLIRLLRIPLFLSLYVQSLDVKDYDDLIGIINWRKVNSTQAIIWNYLQRQIIKIYELSNFGERKLTIDAIIAIEFLLPRIIYKFNSIEVTLEEWQAFFDDAFSDIENNFEHVLHRIRGNVLVKCGRYTLSDYQNSYNQINEILNDELQLIIISSGGYEGDREVVRLVHSEFYDVLTSIAIADQTKVLLQTKTEEYLDLWGKNEFSYSVINNLVTFVEYSDVLKLWNLQNVDGDFYSRLNLFAVLKKKRGNDFSDFTFSEVDLSDISLRGCIFAKGNNSTIFDRVKLSGYSFLPEGHAGKVRSLCYCQSRNLIASSSDDGVVNIWKFGSGRKEYELVGHENIVKSVSFSCNGDYLISGSSDKTIRVWKLDEEEPYCLEVLTDHSQRVSQVIFTNSESSFFSCSDDGTIRKWDIQKGNIVEEQEIYYQNTKVTCMAIDPQNKYLVTGDTKGLLRLWILGRDEPVGPLLKAHEGWVNKLLWCDSANIVVSGSDDGKIVFWEIDEEENIICRNTYNYGDAWLTSIAYDEINNVVAVGLNNGSLVFINLSDYSVYIPNVLNSWVECLTYSSDGCYLILGTSDGNIHILNTSSYEYERKIEGRLDRVSCVTYFDNDRYLITGTYDGTIRIWNLVRDEQNPRVSCIIKTENVSIISLSVSTSKSLIFAGTSMGELLIFSNVLVEDSEIIRKSIKLMGQQLKSIAYTSSNDTIASCSSDTTIYLLRTLSSKPEKLVFDGDFRFRDIVFDKTGRYIITAASDGYLRVVDVHANEKEFFISDVKVSKDGIRSLCLSKSTDILYTASDNGYIRKWNIKYELGNICFSKIQTITGNHSWINNLSVSIDEDYIASDNSDGNSIIWSVNDHDSIMLKTHPLLNLNDCTFIDVQFDSNETQDMVMFNGGKITNKLKVRNDDEDTSYICK